MLEGIDKAVVRGPLRVRPSPPWFTDHPKAGRAGPDLVALEAEPRWARLPGVMRRLL